MLGSFEMGLQNMCVQTAVLESCNVHSATARKALSSRAFAAAAISENTKTGHQNRKERVIFVKCQAAMIPSHRTVFVKCTPCVFVVTAMLMLVVQMDGAVALSILYTRDGKECAEYQSNPGVLFQRGINSGHFCKMSETHRPPSIGCIAWIIKGHLALVISYGENLLAFLKMIASKRMPT
jgi:hypothetical protein